MSFSDLVDSATWPAATDLRREGEVARFLDQASAAKRYVIGRNPQSEALLRLVPIAGLIDDHAADGPPWCGLPIFRMRDVPSDSLILNTSTSIAPVSVNRALERAGFHEHLNLSDLLKSPLCPAALMPEFVTAQRLEITTNAAAWHRLYARLEDEESRRILTDVLRFRLTADAEAMAGYTVRIQDQYFEPFLELSEEVFVDAGGYDGDTTEQFCIRTPDYRRVYIFEPSAANMRAAKRRLAGYPRIQYMQVGLSDAPGELCFDSTSGSASSVSDLGAERIGVDLLDNLVDEAASFIKMDLEGWELHALRGAANQIRTNHPKLAISVYHQASHFREIFELVLSLFPGYRVRLRHYTEGWSETVMFFTP